MSVAGLLICWESIARYPATKPATPLLACAPGGLLFCLHDARYVSAMMRPFTKPPLNISGQIALLESRGMVITDRSLAVHVLTHVSYYRLRAYWYHFEIDPENSAHWLAEGTTLEAVLALYDFDRRLRLLVNDAIERVEVAARGSWAHHLAMTMGPHGYLNDRLYGRPAQYQKNIAQLKEEIARSHDRFIAHYRETYHDPELPPVWMVSEVMSFGLLSKWISTLSSRPSRQGIARGFGLDEKIFTSFIHHLATVRNICAHHGRLWNRGLTVTLTLPNSPSELAGAINVDAPRRIYNTLVLLRHVMLRIAPASDWPARLRDLLGEHPTADLTSMGFPTDWRTRPGWTG